MTKKTVVKKIAEKKVDTFTVEDKKTYDTFSGKQQIYFKAITRLIKTPIVVFGCEAIGGTDDERALLTAARDNDFVKVQELVGKKTCPNIQDSVYERTALHLAANGGYLNIVTALLGHDDIDPNIQDTLGYTALHLAANEGYLNIVTALLGHDDIDPNIQNTLGYTALHMATNEGYLNIVTALLRHDDDIDPNIQNTIDPNIQNTMGYTALHLAANEGYLNIVTALLGHKDINPDKQDALGYTALHLATNNIYLEIVRSLVGANADKNIRGKDDKTARELAKSKKEHYRKIVIDMREEARIKREGAEYSRVHSSHEAPAGYSSELAASLQNQERDIFLRKADVWETMANKLDEIERILN